MSAKRATATRPPASPKPAPHFEMVDPASLRQAPYNPRTISPRALAALARLMDEHGFVDPVIARREDRLLIGGHQRLCANALRPKPDPLVPCIFLDGVSDHQAKALNIALNNPAAQGRYNDGLADLLTELQADLPADEDLSALTGLPQAEIDRLLSGLEDLTDAPLELVLSPDAPAATASAAPPESPAILTFELSQPQYRQLKPVFDDLIARHGLLCHVQM